MAVYKTKDYFDSTLRSLHLCPSVDITLAFHEPMFGYEKSIDIFWHRPSINIGWYPICQIDVDGKTIFHHEGSENADHWDDLLIQAADFLENWKP